MSECKCVSIIRHVIFISPFTIIFFLFLDGRTPFSVKFITDAFEAVDDKGDGKASPAQKGFRLDYTLKDC